MPTASIIVPAYNVASTLRETLQSLLSQTHDDYEIIIVDDGSDDDTIKIAQECANDPKIKLVQQANRGLAGARNSGIAAAVGDYIGFCDADDLWLPTKLAAHVSHLENRPEVGLSFSGSDLIDENSQPNGHAQKPLLTGISADHVFKRNPVGNGSAAVMRRAALQEISYRPRFERSRDWVFDENFRQSEDIECWLRLILTTDWKIEGTEGQLTLYRISSQGLSANVCSQMVSWEEMVFKLRQTNPCFFDQHESSARAYQLRYLARRAISNFDGKTALQLMRSAMAQSTTPIIEEPAKTLTTAVTAIVLRCFGHRPISLASRLLAAVNA